MYKNYDDLPGVLSVKELKDYLGISRAGGIPASAQIRLSDAARRVSFAGGEGQAAPMDGAKHGSSRKRLVIGGIGNGKVYY